MPLRRRETLALTGAFLAGLAGCAGSDPEAGTPTETTNGETTTDGPEPTDTTTDPATFDEFEAPPFPEIDFATDPDLDEELLADQLRGNVAFALDLLGAVREQEGGNVFVSPYSVSVALAMTYAGARGTTREEMADALRFELDGEQLHAAFAALEAEFARRNEDGEDADVRTVSREKDDENAGPAFELTTANGAWGQDGFPFREPFLDLLAAYYGAGLRLADFASDPEAARERINEWVAERTNDRIEDLLPEGSIDTATRLVLANAVYFSARWATPFPEDATDPRPFTALDGSTAEVPTMRQELKTRYAAIEGHQLVELDYANGDTSMVVILPADGEFEAFESSLTVDRLAIMLDRASRAQVTLSLPRFEVETAVSLVESLRALGVAEAFTPRADLSGISDDRDLFVDDVVHQSFVSVDERGTEAAAATAAVVAESALPERVEMTVDRPFLFYIRDKPTETPLFVGRVTSLGDE